MAGVQLAFSTDMRTVEPTIVAVMSALEGTRRPAQIHVFGADLTDAAWDMLERAVRSAPQAEPRFHDMEGILEGRFDPSKFLVRYSPATLATLIIPKLLSGRVLYLDSDTLTHGDVGELFDLDMAGRRVAAVRDYERMQHWYDVVSGVENYPSIKILERVMEPHPVQDFFNGGVVLFDSDAISAEPGLADAIADLSDLDDDARILNRHLKGHVLHLDPSWNVIAGLHHLYGAMHDAVVADGLQSAHDPARITHFFGGTKPWHDFDPDEVETDFHRAKERIWRQLDAQSPIEPHTVLEHLRDRISCVEYASSVRVWRSARDRYMGVLGG